MNGRGNILDTNITGDKWRLTEGLKQGVAARGLVRRRVWLVSGCRLRNLSAC